MQVNQMSLLFLFFFKQKTAYEIRPRDWSSDVCSSDLKGCQLITPDHALPTSKQEPRSEEHTSELQSRGLISYAVFCLKKKTRDKLQASTGRCYWTRTSASRVHRH